MRHRKNTVKLQRTASQRVIAYLVRTALFVIQTITPMQRWLFAHALFGAFVGMNGLCILRVYPVLKIADFGIAEQWLGKILFVVDQETG